MRDKKIQEKDKIILKLKNKKKVQKLKEKGITLIALVVTIIILLILAGVTLNMALSGDGLFSRARDAADKYKKAQEDEQELVSDIAKEMYSEYVGAYVTGYEPTGGTCTITKAQSGVSDEDIKDSQGKEIKKDNEGNQTFTTKEEGDLKWRIWDYDGTILRIILDRPTKQELLLKGVAGYNNGVWAINEICRKCFGQYEKGEMKEGISVANLKTSDIQKVSNYDYTEYINGEEGSGQVVEEGYRLKYGESKDYEGEMELPEMFEIDSKWDYEYKDGKKIGSDSEGLIWETEGNGQMNNAKVEMKKIVKQSFHQHDYKRSEFRNQMYFDLIFLYNATGVGFGQWLAARCVGVTEKGVWFGICGMADGGYGNLIGGFGVINQSNENIEEGAKSCRPVVSIDLNKTNLKLERVEENGNVSFKLE